MDVASHSPPARAQPNADSTNTSRLMATTRTPSEMAAVSLSRMACAAVPTLLRRSRKTTQHSPAMAASAAQ